MLWCVVCAFGAAVRRIEMRRFDNFDDDALPRFVRRQNRALSCSAPTSGWTWKAGALTSYFIKDRTHPQVRSNIFCPPSPSACSPRVHSPLGHVPSPFRAPFAPPSFWYFTLPSFFFMGNTFIMLAMPVAMLISTAVTLVRAESHTIRFNNQ